jgi:type I restriction enzyme, S subunit
MSLLPYAEYKDSGVDWLGDIPATWSTRRTKLLFEIRKRISGEDGHDVLSITQQGIRVKDIESNDGQLSMDYSKYQFVHVGDFAMNHMDLLTGYVDISPFFGVTSPDYRVFAVRDADVCVPRFFLYLFQNGYRQRIFYAFGQGSSQLGRWRFPTEQFNDFVFPLPPREDQKRLADFLDCETAKIDALIAEQEKLLALLAEKRQATISHAVTRGLNPDAPLKDSGIPWLGQVPAHWEVRALKTIVSTPITDGPHETPEFLDGGVPFVSAEAVSSGEIDFSKIRGHISHENNARYSQKYKPELNDIYMVKSGATTGVTAIVEGRADFNIWSPLAAIRCNKVVANPRYILQFLRSRNFQEGVALNWSFGTQQNIGMGVLGDLSVALPPLEEQEQIAAALKGGLDGQTALMASAQSAIPLLKERRSALIAAAVTGQIDVRGLAA